MDIKISKINDIRILQTGTSSLKIINKKEQQSDVQKGVNKQIDLGKGVQTLNIQFKVLDTDTFDSVYDILVNERECTLTDKFIGTIKVSVDKVTITHTDKEFGVTTFDVSFKITEEFIPNVDYTGRLNNYIADLDNEQIPNYISSNIPELPVHDITITPIDLDMKDITQFKSANRAYLHNINQNTKVVNCKFLQDALKVMTTTDYFEEVETLGFISVLRLDSIILGNQIGFNTPELGIDWQILKNTIGQFVNNCPLKVKTKIYISKEQTLLRIVREIYGDLEMYRDIYDANNFENANQVRGWIWIYI